MLQITFVRLGKEAHNCFIDLASEGRVGQWITSGTCRKYTKKPQQST